MRQYQINGKIVGREIWHEHLLMGDWEVASLHKANKPKDFEAPSTENVISTEEAKRIRAMWKPPTLST